MQVVFSQRRMTSFSREFRLLLKNRSAKQLLQLTQMLLRMPLQPTAEESRKALQGHGPDSKDLSSDESGNKEREDQIIEPENNEGCTSTIVKESEQGLEGQGISGAYDSGKSTIRVLSLLSWKQHRYRHACN
jgi:hypothetical protein